MATAFDLMRTAKQRGAKARNEESWSNFQEALTQSQRKQEKRDFWGGLGKMGLQAALGASGLGPLAVTMVSGAGGEAIDALFGGDVKAPELGGAAKGAYGQATRKAMQRQRGAIADEWTEGRKAKQRGDMLGYLMAGALSGMDELKQLFKGDTSFLGEGAKSSDVLEWLFKGDKSSILKDAASAAKTPQFGETFASGAQKLQSGEYLDELGYSVEPTIEEEFLSSLGV